MAGTRDVAAASGLDASSGDVEPGTDDQGTAALDLFVNVPLGAVAVLVTDRVLRRVPHDRRPHTVDYLGVAVLIAGVSCLLLTTSLGGVRYPWTSPLIVGLGLLGACLAVLLVVVERLAVSHSGHWACSGAGCSRSPTRQPLCSA